MNRLAPVALRGRQLVAKLAAVSLAAGVGLAHAAAPTFDVTPATDAITSATTAVLAVIAAMTIFAGAFMVARKVYQLIKRG